MLALHELGTIKPVVALADGVVMGAGAGLFMAATTRVLGPKALFAMCATHSAIDRDFLNVFDANMLDEYWR